MDLKGFTCYFPILYIILTCVVFLFYKTVSLISLINNMNIILFHSQDILLVPPGRQLDWEHVKIEIVSICICINIYI